MKNKKNTIIVFLSLTSIPAYSFVLPVPVVPITGVSLTTTAATNIANLASNSARIPFLLTAASNSMIVLKENKKTKKILINTKGSFQNNLLKNETKQAVNTLYGSNKLSGKSWAYKNSNGRNVDVQELDASPAIKDMKKNFTQAGELVPFNVSNILFNEELGIGNGEMTTFDLPAKNNNQLSFEIKALSKIEKIKSQLIDKITKTSRYKDYMGHIDGTASAKSSVDLRNLFAQEKLIKQKLELEEEINLELIKTYKNILKSASQYQVSLAAGKLHTFTIRSKE